MTGVSDSRLRSTLSSNEPSSAVTISRLLAPAWMTAPATGRSPTLSVPLIAAICEPSSFH
ncbi:hypothetical protein [Cohnella rhizosphaerae]|uniref:Uncharacterized protein n=1 Tax=Cohnella rhizosphaerae TaxID=1457232 RepID=A0A9X4QR61_9BACL|nr:hypothetical protein [Cohnella rhizosphaerae]MDG0808255.1 hypothetical protein [Cohnella rhizosphaerae]